MKFSKFGEKFTKNTGILELMDDLGKAMSGTDKKIMLGGGNPAHIPGMQKAFRHEMEEIMKNENEFEKLISNYDTQQGNTDFINEFVKFINSMYKWNISSKNIAITNGSQSGFFILFNILAGENTDGSKGKILFPIAPEYIGYADQGLNEDMFVSFMPEIKIIDKHTFKYYIDFDAINKYSSKNKEDIRAICISRPTNPTGNVITDDEVEKLREIAARINVPLIIDNAYGKPFPNAIFVDSNITWDENTVLSMSLSKIGLPSSRTGIFIANQEIINAIGKVNAILSLSNGGYGQALVKNLLKEAKLINLCEQNILPYYTKKLKEVKYFITKYFDDKASYYVHKTEGSFFLWFWFKGLPISSKDLYNRLKERNVIVVPGEYFFPGINEKNWKHQYECIRVNYGTASSKDIEEGIKILGQILSSIKK